MNSVVLIGRLARDPELSYTSNSQTPMCRFTLAVDRPRRNGEDAGADFLRVVVFGRQAETCDRYLSKGRQAAVHGRIETGSYKNREGVTVYTTDIIADRVEFLGGGQDRQGGQGSGSWQGSGFGGQSSGGFGGQNTGFGAPQNSFGGSQDDFGSSQGNDFGFGDLPDTFQAAEDDIPF
jgi:single-strand DNA-binding protein